MQKEINLLTVQGIGDIFWVYQKFCSYFDIINFYVCYIEDTPIQRRSEKWVKILPKANVFYHQIQARDYDYLLTRSYKMKSLLNNYNKNPKGKFYYACNKELETGNRLENINKEYETAWNIKLPLTPISDINQDYIVLYVSGSVGSDGVWTEEQWIDFVEKFYIKYKINYPIYIIGAKFDENKVLSLSNKLKIKNYILIDKEPSEVCWLLKNAKFFIGYQSGLSIIADNLNTKQIMLYYDKLTKLRNSWPKKKNIENKIYTSGLFGEKPEKVLSYLPNDLFTEKIKII